MLPEHIFVPMATRRHDDLYEDYVGSSKMLRHSESMIERNLRDGMSECPEDIPTTFIDEDEL